MQFLVIALVSFGLFIVFMGVVSRIPKFREPDGGGCSGNACEKGCACIDGAIPPEKAFGKYHGGHENE